MRWFPALFLVAVLSAAQAATPYEDVAARDHGLNAAIARGDVETARAYYHDAFVLTTSTGKPKHKADMLADIGNPTLRLDVNETREVAVRVHDRTAVLTGILHQRGSIGGRAFDVQLHVTDTWVQDRQGRWLLLAGHASTR